MGSKSALPTLLGSSVCVMIRSKFSLSSPLFVKTYLPFQCMRDCFRLGKFQPDRHRGILVKLSSVRDVSMILANRTKLSDKPNISIKPDMSKDERECESLLLKERRRLLDLGVERKSIKLRNDLIYVDNVKRGSVKNLTFCPCVQEPRVEVPSTTPQSSTDDPPSATPQPNVEAPLSIIPQSPVLASQESTDVVASVVSRRSLSWADEPPCNEAVGPTVAGNLSVPSSPSHLNAAHSSK